MKHIKKLAVASLLGLSAILCGCDGGGDDGHSFNVGDNDPNVIVCIGDSITQGYACEGAPYPSYLAALTGKSVRNGGIAGAQMHDGINSAQAALGVKPGYMCIMYGSNDAIRERDIEEVVSSLTTIIELCRANQTIPIVALPPPQTGEHAIFNGKLDRINEAIKNTCDSLGVKCVDVNRAFGDTPEIYQTSDGLHPNAEGSQIIAQQFARCF